jgi:hypothetical protein
MQRQPTEVAQMADKTKTPDYRRFVVQTKLNSAELEALHRLSDAERLPAAQVVRRLIWREAQQLPPEQQTTQPATA